MITAICNFFQAYYDLRIENHQIVISIAVLKKVFQPGFLKVEICYLWKESYRRIPGKKSSVEPMVSIAWNMISMKHDNVGQIYTNDFSIFSANVIKR
jgi:hypothetical protein